MATTSLPRSTPAEPGVASRGVAAFLDAMEAAPDIELHSVMLLRHGHVVAEGWWAPYGPDEVHLLYSLSKTFTATAAALAAAEGLLSFDDLVTDHFPELAHVVTDPRSQRMRVRDLAAMATGHRDDTLDRMFQLDATEPVRGFLSLPPEEEPGSVFCYNNGATYTLGAIVQRVAGQSLSAYLQPRLFEPLGIPAPYWIARPAGREIGFSGLHLTTEAVARLGQLYLDDGVWQGARLLPAGWVADASRVHTANPAEPNPDWQQGYGYQIWRARHGYRGDGAYGQFCIVLPEEDVVLAITAQTENMQGILDAAWTHLLPAVDASTPEQDSALAARLNALALTPGDDGISPTAEPGADVTLTVGGVVVEKGGGWRLTITDDDLPVRVGDGAWLRNDLTLPGGYRVLLAASGRQVDGSLVAQLIALETPHRLTLTVDLASGASTARWRTVPLHSPTIAQLATGGH
ncbi:serine hydrolase domain-containing protein [uncultured Friedmanniella sp.]|uniref:serine hydrolase domain-containing protein n=1 Tax=uncultured Friedmanniella sp. TaxID=335381 RepID=UPI0035CAC954